MGWGSNSCYVSISCGEKHINKMTRNSRDSPSILVILIICVCSVGFISLPKCGEVASGIELSGKGGRSECVWRFRPFGWNTNPFQAFIAV